MKLYRDGEKVRVVEGQHKDKKGTVIWYGIGNCLGSILIETDKGERMSLSCNQVEGE